MSSARALLGCAVVALGLGGCHRDMYEQPKYLPEKPNFYFPQTSVDRLPVAHTVPRGPIVDDSPFYTGKNGAALATTFPYPMTEAMVRHGREIFEINCSACHGRDGYGQGMIVQRGFPPPPSYHSARLRNAPLGHFFDVITNGYGAMYPFGSRIPPADRWAVIAYIRALQLSQAAPVTELNAQDQTELEKVP